MKAPYKEFKKYSLLLTTAIVLCAPMGQMSIAQECVDSASEGRVCAGDTTTEAEALAQEAESLSSDTGSTPTGGTAVIKTNPETVTIIRNIIGETNDGLEPRQLLSEAVDTIHPDVRDEVKTLMISLASYVIEEGLAEGQSAEEIAEVLTEVLQRKTEEFNQIVDDAEAARAEAQAVLDDEEATLEEIAQAEEEIKALEEEAKAKAAEAVQEAYDQIAESQGQSSNSGGGGGDKIKDLLSGLLGGGQQQQNPGSPSDFSPSSFSPSSPGAVPDALASKKSTAKNSVDKCKTKKAKESKKIKVKIKVAKDPKKKAPKKKGASVREKSKSIFHAKREGWDNRWGAKLILAKSDEKAPATKETPKNKEAEDKQKTEAPGHKMSCTYPKEVGTVIHITANGKQVQCTVSKNSGSSKLIVITPDVAKLLNVKASGKGTIEFIEKQDCSGEEDKKEDNSSTGADFDKQKISPNNKDTWDAARENSLLLREPRKDAPLNQQNPQLKSHQNGAIHGTNIGRETQDTKEIGPYWGRTR